jgi:anti-sigma regulatory factor (Ser/Thr protein kinase)
LRFLAEFRFAAEPAEVPQLRRAVRERLGPVGLVGSDLDRLILVLDEIVGNSIEHGRQYRVSGDVLSVRLLVDRSGRVDVEFHDPSVPVEVADDLRREFRRHDNGDTTPPVHNERGRGLFLIAEAFDTLQVDRGPNGRGLLLRGVLRRDGT